MLPARHTLYEDAETSGPVPVGWRLAMRLCNLLIALTATGLALLLAYEFKLHSFF